MGENKISTHYNKQIVGISLFPAAKIISQLEDAVNFSKYFPAILADFRRRNLLGIKIQ